MISQKIQFYEETIKHKTTNYETQKARVYSMRECYTLIKKYKKKGFKIGVTVGSQYNQKPMGIITGFITPPKDGITVWGNEPSLIEVENIASKYKTRFRVSELICYKTNQITGNMEPC